MRNDHKRRVKSFIKLLLKNSPIPKRLKPRQIYVFNVMANYGNYQIVIGPEYTPGECKKLHLKPHTRRLEINGNMHHLFVNPKRISPTPNQEDIRSNLKGSVIMRDIVIHLIDRNGEGTGITIERSNLSSGIRAMRRINLAGENGISLIERYKTTGKLINETYKIIQEDILKALKGH